MSCSSDKGLVPNRGSYDQFTNAYAYTLPGLNELQVIVEKLAAFSIDSNQEAN